MRSIPHKCQRYHSEQEFSVKEQLSEVIFINSEQRRIHQIQVDGCVFKDSDGKRCDHLVNVGETETSVLVELKGSDIMAAFDQLKETQERLVEHINRRVFWIISYSGSPRIETTIQDLILKAAHQKKARLIVEATPYSHLL